MVIANPPLAEPVIDPGGVTIKPPFEMGVANLFQAADLICTMELLAEKAESNSFSRSEQEFFCSVRDFKKNYLKPLLKKHL